MAKNKQKSKTLSLATLVVFALSGLLLSAGGIFYVVVKNKQVQTQREIAKIQKQMQEHEVAITSHKADIEDHLGVFRLKENAVVKQSGLVPIPSGLIEVCEQKSNDEPPDQALARRR